MPRNGTGKDIIARLSRHTLWIGGVALALGAAPVMAQDLEASEDVVLSDSARISLPGGGSIITGTQTSKLNISGGMIANGTVTKARASVKAGSARIDDPEVKTHTTTTVAGEEVVIVSAALGGGQQQRPRL